MREAARSAVLRLKCGSALLSATEPVRRYDGGHQAEEDRRGSPGIKLTAQDNPPNSPRSRRDTYLGAAAAALAGSYFLTLLGPVSVGLYSDTRVLALMFNALDVAGLLALSAGFILAAVGFLGQLGSRAGRLRRAGQAWVVGSCAIFAAYVAVFFLDPFVSGPTPVFYRTQIISSLAYGLFIIIAAILVTRAFGSATDAVRRGHRLAWALVAVGAGVALPMPYQYVAGWWDFFPLAEPLNAFSLAHSIFLMLAAATGAAAFFRATRPFESPLSERLTTRDARLVFAALLLLISYVLGFIAAILLARFRTLGFQVFMSQPDVWLPAAGDALLVVAGALATLGFLASRRSSFGRDAALHPSVMSTEQ